MKLIGVMMVRDEDWILGYSLRVALKWCDEVIIFNHASTDDTQYIVNDIAYEHPGRIIIMYDGNPDWDEMNQRQQTLKMERERGATHIAIIDADEALTADQLPKIKELIQNLKDGESIAVPMIPIWNDLDHYRDDNSVWSRAWLSLIFKDWLGLTWRPEKGGYQHHHRLPYGIGKEIRLKIPGVMHLQFANKRRLLAKHVLYRMVDYLRWPKRDSVEKLNKKYDQALNEENLRRSPCQEEWWDTDLRKHITLKGIPWQENEIRRLLLKHGPKKFEGLNLYGYE